MTGVDSGFVFGIKSFPGCMFHFSLGGTSGNSGVNTVEFSKSGGELLFSIGKKGLSISNGLVA